ncbi:MAG: chromosome segregation protein SMC [Candidatus Zixiibacteriota bacterium]
MFLSKLQLLGFKSFPEKTDLVFNRGIASIVGPNGCGKTNLLDAIRWVLGESRMSVLRGARLEEIIFAGTRDYKPQGMAEVSLTFDNHDHSIPSGYDEISITRRLYRSGDSEFLINRTPCRLKDITEMFLDTGVAPGAYSVIEQSMVDVLLSDKTEDRRFLFEEAAGITKYKQRKRQALRKLESTEADLLRLQDVLAEVEAQVSALKRQVSKAERHRTLGEEIKRIGISLSSAEWNALEEKRADLAKQMAQKRIEAEANIGRQRECELKREKIALERTEFERRSREIQAELEAAIDRCHKLENEISVLKEKERNAAESYTRAGNEVESLLKRQDSLEDEIAENTQKQSECGGQIDSLNAKLAAVEDDLHAKLSDCTSLHEHVEKKQSCLNDLAVTLAGRRENQLSLDLRYSADSDKLTEMNGEIERLSKELERISSELSAGESEAEDFEQLLASHKDKITTLDNSARILGEDVENLEARKRELVGRLEKAVTRMEFLEKVIAEYDGYNEGTAAIGQLKDEIPGLLDTVANLIETDHENSPLIQAVLGEYAGYFVVEDEVAANAVLERVRSEKLGRVGLIVKSRVSDLSNSVSGKIPDGFKPIRALVGGDDDLSQVFDFLFDDHCLVGDGDFSQAVNNPQLTLWTAEGEVVAAGGRVRAVGSHEIVLVGRKGDCQALASERQDLIDIIARVNHDKVEAARKRNDLIAEMSSLEHGIAEIQQRLTGLSIKNSNLKYEITTLSNGKTEKERVRSSLAGSLDVISRDKGQLTQELEAMLAQKAEMESDLTVAAEDVAAAEQEYATCEKDNNRLRMELVGLEGRLDTLRSNQARLDELGKDVLDTIKLRESQQSEHLRTASESKRLTRDHEADLKKEYIVEEEKRREAVAISSAISEVDCSMSEIDKELKELRQESSKSTEMIHELDLGISAIHSRKENLVEDSIEHYEFDPSTSSLKVKLTDEQRSEMTDELYGLRDRLSSLGPVNMLAIDEYDEQNKRFEFLSEQVQDLETAKEDLRSTITKINSTAKRLFIETLEEVRGNFREVFQDLFEGGEADVYLEEGVDPLEANIIIKARPRGKKILSIQQLSGGERALTSISLLFSLYLVKPSPFCILDEVDAPLDDSNIKRFLKMISRFSENTQFLIITHNKLTMEAADVLYGVTMKHPGVSQIVSVNLSSDADVDKLLGQSTTTASAPETEEAVEIES